MKNIITCKNLYSDGKLIKNQKISIKNCVIEKIETIGEDNKFDFDNIAPALVDLHINGGEEFHFTHSPTQEAIEDIEMSANKNGVGFVLPTLITSSIENIFKGLNAIKKYSESNPKSGVLGMHLEGPFISIKKRGAHLEKYIRKSDEQILKEILDFGGKYLKMITIAPENFTENQIRMLADSGVTVSVGHSNCSFAQAQSAFGLGVNLVTHLFNAMSPLGHREPGLAGASLYNNEVFTPIILDNVHVDKKVAQLAFRLKKEKLFLISDALFQNHKKETFKWEEFDAFLSDGNYVNSEGNLAGATISMADAVKNAKDWLDVDTQTAIKMGTSIPSKILKTDRNFGKIEIGYEAKFCTFDDDLLNFKAIN